MRYGSDAIVEWLVRLGIRHVALNPGATIRGLHESLVREERLTTVLALHEETAVGMAHGYWKATGRPMAVLLHDLVGVQHASMALFNATLDRVPMLVLGGSGPYDERGRRPWLDWIHASSRHSASVQDVVKLTAEPGSLVGVRDAMVRGLTHALSSPPGPAYIAVDTDLQEAPIDGGEPEPPAGPPSGFVAQVPTAEIDQVTDALLRSARPVIVVDRPVPGGAAMLAELADRVGVAVLDLGGGFSFAGTHPADQSDARESTLANADLVLVIEARDVVWALSNVDTGTRRRTLLTPDETRVVAVGCGPLLNIPGVVTEEVLPGARVLAGDAGHFLSELLGRVGRDANPEHSVSPERRAELAAAHDAARAASRAEAHQHAGDRPIHPAHLVYELGRAVLEGADGQPWLLANGIVKGWPRRLWTFGREGEFIGRSGGEGLGYGLPASLGAALAHAEEGPLVVNLQSDGDLMYTASAFWTAAHHQLPLLTVMYDNGTYGKDELHQRELARLRGRSMDTTHIGIRLDQPRIDFAALAQAQGVESFGPIEDPARLGEVLARAVHIVRSERRPVLVHAVCS